MKKIWILLSLVLMAVGCTENEGPSQDGGDATGDCTVPSSVYAGDDAVVQWDGFKETDGLCLASAAGQDYEVEVKTVSTSGLIFHVPVSMPAGNYMLVLLRDGRTELGTITVLAAKMPVSGVEAPAAALCGDVVTVAGLGFKQGCVICLVDTEGEHHKMETVLAAAGVDFTVPDDIPEGVYEMYLEQDGMSWLLSSLEIKEKTVIKSLKALRYYTPYLSGTEQMYEWKIGGDDPLSITVSHYIVENDVPALNVYDSYIGTGEYSFALEYDEMETSNNETMDFVLGADGNVEIADVLRYGRTETTPYIWTYNQDGQLESIDLPGGSLISLSYTDGNLTAFDLTGFKYEDASLKNHPYAWNVAWAYAAFGYETNGEAAPYIPYLLGWFRPSASLLPSSILLPEASGSGHNEYVLEYEFDADGYVEVMSWEGGACRVVFFY